MLATDDPFDEAEKHQLQRGTWVVGGLETRVFWPKRAQLIAFEGLEFLLQPTQKDEQRSSLSAIALRISGYGLSVNEGRAAIMRLATAIAWREGEKVEIVIWGGGGYPHRVGMLRNNGFSNCFSTENLHSPQSDEARRAMAYYREGLSLDNPFYSFLGFYKAFARSLPVGKERGPWIQQTLPKLTERSAISRRDELLAQGTDISDYVATQGRHAIAHAERDDIVDPDDPDDHQRIHMDRPLMRHLAEMAMEERLGVPSRWAYERDHFYELEGFRSLFDADQLEGLKQGVVLPERKYELPDEFYVLARREQSTFHLGVMHVADSAMEDGNICIRLESQDGRLAFLFWMDFRSERLIINPLEGCGLLNDRRESKSDLQSELLLNEFRFALYCNSSVEIWSSDKKQRLGKSMPYILPTNSMPNFERHERTMKELNAMLEGLPGQEEP
ncbi:methylamine utilization protein MauJ [Pseudomonas sp. HLT2-19-2]